METKTDAPKPKSLVTKLSEVMGAVNRIPKRGRNDFHKYDYATEADIVEAVRGEMALRFLMLIPSVEKTEWRKMPGKNGEVTICTLTVRFTVEDGETGEKREFVMMGEGQDQGDKATYKAMTGAEKYALLKLFMIPTGDDPEADLRTFEAAVAREKAMQGRRAAPSQVSAKTATAPKTGTSPTAQDAAAKVGAEQIAARHTLRVSGIWKRAQALGMTKDTFANWRLTTLQGLDVPSRELTDAQIKLLEDDLAEREIAKAGG